MGPKKTKSPIQREEGAKVEEIVLGESLSGEIGSFHDKLIREVVSDVFESRREFFIHEIANRLSPHIGQGSIASQSGGTDDDWIGIESMSKLRGLVGGRFQNIKEKWTNAGFPLREHRGDRDADVKINEEGWLDLCNWMAKQGYEARLSPDFSTNLFELKKFKE